MKKLFSLFSIALLTMSAWAANTYVKVTSLDQMEAGQKYIVVNEENGYAMGPITGTSTNYGSIVAVTIDNGVIDIEDTDVVELTAGLSSVTAYGQTWNFRLDDDTYIIWTQGNSLSRINIGTGASGVMWIPTLTSDGVILKNNADITRILQYNNSGAARFACYASAQAPAVLYVQGTPEEEGITTLSQANALEDNAEFTFDGDAVVTAFTTYQNVSYLFVRDESGYGMFAGVDGTFANGQVLSQGWTATKTNINDGWVRFIDAAGLSASGETNLDLAAAQKLTGAADVNESMINAFVYVENQSSMFPPRSYTLPDGTTIARTEVLGGINWGGGGLNVYGVICKVDGTLKLNPLFTMPYVEPQPEGLRGDVNMSEEVTIADVSALIDYLLTGDATGISLENADCNLVDGVTIADVSALIDYLLTNSWD